MADDSLEAFYRRCNACCNERRFADLGEFIARDVPRRTRPDRAPCRPGRIAEVWGCGFHLHLLDQLR